MYRSIVVAVCAVFAVGMSLTCSPMDSGQAAGSTSPDAGPIWTTSDGLDGGSADAGGGQPPDAGSAGGTAAACDGVVPASNPPRQSAAVPHAQGEVCWFFTSDEQGNVGAESHSGSDFSNVQWSFFPPAGGSRTGTARAGVDLFGQPGGFEGTHRESGSTYLVKWSAAGAEQSRTSLGGNGCHGEAFPSMQKGTLVLGGCDGGALTATIFDAEGRLRVSGSVADRLVNAVGAVDAIGRVIVVVWPAGAIGISGASAGRWFDSSLNPTTGWFQLPGDGQRPSVGPLIGGGVAVQQSDGSWVASVASNQAGFGEAPAWLASHALHEFMIIRQGRAYALIPKSGASASRNVLQLYDGAGNSCGSGTFPGGGLAVGHDGTVIAADGSDGCSVSWWSGVLR